MKKEYLNEQDYKKKLKTIFIISIFVLIGGLVGGYFLFKYGLSQYDAGNTIYGQEMITIAVAFILIGVGMFIWAISLKTRRKRLAMALQETLPLEQEATEKMGPSVAKVAGEVAGEVTKEVKKNL